MMQTDRVRELSALHDAFQVHMCLVVTALVLQTMNEEALRREQLKSPQLLQRRHAQ